MCSYRFDYWTIEAVVVVAVVVVAEMKDRWSVIEIVRMQKDALGRLMTKTKKRMKVLEVRQRSSSTCDCVRRCWLRCSGYCSFRCCCSSCFLRSLPSLAIDDDCLCLDSSWHRVYTLFIDRSLILEFDLDFKLSCVLLLLVKEILNT